MDVPTATTLADIYSEDALGIQLQRWETLLADFKTEYGCSADFVSRSPGRVNLIGEHIDYSLYDVLPMAVTVDILLAVAVRPNSENTKIRLANSNGKFQKREFEVPSHGDVPIDASSLEWSNYFKAGLQGATQLLRKKNPDYKVPSLDILVDGTVPAGGGLSSSAAFVCASALAVMQASGEQAIDKKELVEVAIVSERNVGVNSGGMDQSASVFGQRGNALYVAFKPILSATPVPIPYTNPEITIVVAQSFVAADKHHSGPVCYNLRVVECSLAAVFLAKILRLKKDLPKDSAPLGVSLRGLHDTYFEEHGDVEDNSKASTAELQEQLEKLTQLVEDYLHQEDGYTREEIAGLLGISVDALNQRFTSKFPVRAERFMLRQRALHVFGEAIRVFKFKALLTSPPSSEKAGEESLQEALGALMNETQNSCRDVYECSCPELDELCSLARKAGAYGSRLTGAGWGGCSVHLVPSNKVEQIKEIWEREYYRKKWPDISDEKLRDAVVVSKPSSGSFLFHVTGENLRDR